MENTKKYSIKSDFTMFALLLIPVAVAVNFVGGQLAINLKLPFYLDTIGTILIAMLCGPWVGAVAGLLTNLAIGITNPIFLAFAIVNVALGLVTGFLARAKFFNVWWKWIISVLCMSLVSILISTPIAVLVFGGVTDSGTSLVIATLLASGADIWSAVFGTELIFTAVDRVISILLTYLVIKVIPARTLVKLPCGENYIGLKKKAE